MLKYAKSTSIRGVNSPQLLFYSQNLKNCPTSEYGFLKIFATCEQWVRIYRTYCSLGCKNNNIILIENIYTLSPHYMVQTNLLFSLILFSHLSPSLSNCRSSFAHATPITFFPSTFFFSSSLYCSIPKLKIQGFLV